MHVQRLHSHLRELLPFLVPSQAPASSCCPKAPCWALQSSGNSEGSTAECPAQGQQPLPALPATAMLLAEETSRYFKNINNHLDSAQMLLCNITASNMSKCASFFLSLTLFILQRVVLWDMQKAVVKYKAQSNNWISQEEDIGDPILTRPDHFLNSGFFHSR